MERWTGGKGFKRYFYTLEDIARESGKALQTVRNDVGKGKFNPSDLKDVVDYIGKRKHKREEQT